jgi:hypothetical protein
MTPNQSTSVVERRAEAHNLKISEIISIGSSVTCLGVPRQVNPSYNQSVIMRSNGSISRMCWIEGRACPRRYLSVLPSHVRANLFGSD